MKTNLPGPGLILSLLLAAGCGARTPLDLPEDQSASPVGGSTSQGGGAGGGSVGAGGGFAAGGVVGTSSRSTIPLGSTGGTVPFGGAGGTSPFCSTSGTVEFCSTAGTVPIVSTGVGGRGGAVVGGRGTVPFGGTGGTVPFGSTVRGTVPFGGTGGTIFCTMSGTVQYCSSLPFGSTTIPVGGTGGGGRSTVPFGGTGGTLPFGGTGGTVSAGGTGGYFSILCLSGTGFFCPTGGTVPPGCTTGRFPFCGTGGTVSSGGTGGTVSSGGRSTGGSGAVGGTGTAGSGGTAGTACPGLAPMEDLIDDMNDGDRFIPQVHGRAGAWSDSDDSTPGSTIFPDPVRSFTMTWTGDSCRQYAAYVYGGPFVIWGADFWFGLGSPYNAQTYGGISFWAKIDGGTSSVLRVAFPDKDTQPDGGLCQTNVTGPTQCFDHYGTRITLTTTWQKYTIPFYLLTQDGWGRQGGAFDPSTLYEVLFQIPVNAKFGVWIDDVAFFVLGP